MKINNDTFLGDSQYKTDNHRYKANCNDIWRKSQKALKICSACAWLQTKVTDKRLQRTDKVNFLGCFSPKLLLMICLLKHRNRFAWIILICFQYGVQLMFFSH